MNFEFISLKFNIFVFFSSQKTKSVKALLKNTNSRDFGLIRIIPVFN